MRNGKMQARTEPRLIFRRSVEAALALSRAAWRVARPCVFYLQGGTEYSHGLTSSLLSNIAIRSGEIAESIIARRADRRAERAIPAEVGVVVR